MIYEIRYYYLLILGKNLKLFVTLAIPHFSTFFFLLSFLSSSSQVGKLKNKYHCPSRQETVTGLILLNVMVESQAALDRVGNKEQLKD